MLACRIRDRWGAARIAINTGIRRATAPRWDRTGFSGDITFTPSTRARPFAVDRLESPHTIVSAGPVKAIGPTPSRYSTETAKPRLGKPPSEPGFIPAWRRVVR